MARNALARVRRPLNPHFVDQTCQYVLLQYGYIATPRRVYGTIEELYRDFKQRLLKSIRVFLGHMSGNAPSKIHISPGLMHGVLLEYLKEIVLYKEYTVKRLFLTGVESYEMPILDIIRYRDSALYQKLKEML